MDPTVDQSLEYFTSFFFFFLHPVMSTLEIQTTLLLFTLTKSYSLLKGLYIYIYIYIYI